MALEFSPGTDGLRDKAAQEPGRERGRSGCHGRLGRCPLPISCHESTAHQCQHGLWGGGPPAEPQRGDTLTWTPSPRGHKDGAWWSWWAQAET